MDDNSKYADKAKDLQIELDKLYDDKRRIDASIAIKSQEYRQVMNILSKTRADSNIPKLWEKVRD